jgi:hypothetical protein
MAKTWVLDTETKGTGAEVVPYEKTLRRPKKERELALVNLGGRAPVPRPDPAPEPQRFRVVDVMTSEVLLEDGDIREAIAALRTLHSVVDARMFMWSPERRHWRLLTLDESKALWSFRARLDSPAAEARGSRDAG